MFHYEGGIKEFVSYLNKRKDAALSERSFTVREPGTAFLWRLPCSTTTLTHEGVYSFVNNITTPEGGTHLTGFKNALTKTFNDYAQAE